MTTLDTEIVKRTAKLAMLNPSDTQLEVFAQELSDIFHLFDTLNRDDIRALPPLGHPLEGHQLLRDDVVTPCDMLPSMQENVPQLEDNFILVPKVIE